jgi:hypothetical protein
VQSGISLISDSDCFLISMHCEKKNFERKQFSNPKTVSLELSSELLSAAGSVISCFPLQGKKVAQINTTFDEKQIKSTNICCVVD